MIFTILLKYSRKAPERLNQHFSLRQCHCTGNGAYKQLVINSLNQLDTFQSTQQSSYWKNVIVKSYVPRLHQALTYDSQHPKCTLTGIKDYSDYEIKWNRLLTNHLKKFKHKQQILYRVFLAFVSLPAAWFRIRISFFIQFLFPPLIYTTQHSWLNLHRRASVLKLNKSKSNSNNPCWGKWPLLICLQNVILHTLAL